MSRYAQAVEELEKGSTLLDFLDNKTHNVTLVTAFDSYANPEWTALRDTIKAKPD